MKYIRSRVFPCINTDQNVRCQINKMVLVNNSCQRCKSSVFQSLGTRSEYICEYGWCL